MVGSTATTIPMNSTITFPTPTPALKLARPSSEKWAATLAEERRRLQEDQDALREREANLREYEMRLRSLQAEIDAGRNGSANPSAPARPAPFARPPSQAHSVDDPALQAAWEKLHRARALLEAEQTHLRDDRITLQDHDAALQRRETAVAAREARLAEREAMVAAALPPPVEAEPAVSAMGRLTRAPFEMARAVFGGRK